jgi:hypothetical protein
MDVLVLGTFVAAVSMVGTGWYVYRGFKPRNQWETYWTPWKWAFAFAIMFATSVTLLVLELKNIHQ